MDLSEEEGVCEGFANGRVTAAVARENVGKGDLAAVGRGNIDFRGYRVP